MEDAVVQALQEAYTEEHKALEQALKDFGDLGYLIGSIAYKGGRLEIVCRPPKKERN